MFFFAYLHQETGNQRFGMFTFANGEYVDCLTYTLFEHG